VIGERCSATKERARILNGLKSKGIAEEGCGLATLPMILRQRPGGRSHPTPAIGVTAPQAMRFSHSLRNRPSWRRYEAVALTVRWRFTISSTVFLLADFPVRLSVTDQFENARRILIRLDSLARPTPEDDTTRLGRGDAGAHAFAQQIALELSEGGHQRGDQFALGRAEVELQPGLPHDCKSFNV